MVSLNPEAALARELFDYSPETGLLTKKETGKNDWASKSMDTWSFGSLERGARCIVLSGYGSQVTGPPDMNQAPTNARPNAFGSAHSSMRGCGSPGFCCYVLQRWRNQ